MTKALRYICTAFTLALASVNALAAIQADVNGDGEVNISDALTVVDRILGRY